MAHIIINGERGAGKSTLISTLIRGRSCPISGFITHKEGDGRVYIHPAAGARLFAPANNVGCCISQQPESDWVCFDRHAGLVEDAPAGCLLVMDELGTMESGADRFTRAVLRAFDRMDVQIIAALRKRPSPFLERVWNHPNAVVYDLFPDNREALTKRLTALITSPD